VVAETAGERYPYDQLYRWLASTGARGEVRILGRDYEYRDDFYLHKYALPVVVNAPRARSPRALDLRDGDAVDPATQELVADLRRLAFVPGDGLRIVVAHLRGGADARVLPETMGRWRRGRTFRLGEQALVVYLYD
jgi:hypothetical protein